MKRILTIIVAAVLLAGWPSGSALQAAGLPVVPGGFGFGMDTRAAYACGSNPAIYIVRSLANSGGQTLREALEASGPRVVVFETSGYIQLTSDITVTNPCLTVAGQTAPSPGVTVRNFGINIYTHDVLIQHMRIRPGDGPPFQSNTAGHDALITYSGNAYNVVFDHNSVSWAQGKNMQVFSVAANAGVTLWRNIDSEALYKGQNVTFLPSEPSSLSVLLSNYFVGVPFNVSVIGNIFAHNAARNPEMTGPVNVHFINNVVYDWGKDVDNTYQWASITYLGTVNADLIGNVYIAGVPPFPFTPLYAIASYNAGTGTQVYHTDNALDTTNFAITPFFVAAGFDPTVSSPPVSLSGISVLPSGSVQAFVLANAGARPTDRDAVDARIVSEIGSHTGNTISSQNTVGGWPSLAVNTTTLAVPSNPHAVQASGYTALEEWLHTYAAALEAGGTIPPPRNVRITASAASAESDAVCALLNNGFLDIYSGTQPTDADTAITSQTRLASLGFGATACTAATAGVASATSITADPAAANAGIATWFRAWKSDHTSAVFDGSVDTASADLVLTTTLIASGKPVTVTGFTITSRTE